MDVIVLALRSPGDPFELFIICWALGAIRILIETTNMQL